MFNNDKIKALQGRVETLTNAMSQQTLKLRDVMQNALGISHGGERSLYDIYGYPERYDYKQGYEYLRRECISSRVCRGIPESCWRNGFTIKVDQDDDAEEILTDEIAMLAKRGLFQRLERTDVLNRIGNFSIMYVGIPDGLDPREPVGAVRGDGYKSIFFRCFGYDGVTIAAYNQDPTSERFQLPELYQLQTIQRGDNDKSIQTQPIIVHHSRVVHMSESLLDDDLEGVSIMETIFNRIIDIDKSTGGAAEAYFRNARGKIAFEVDKEFAPDLLTNETAKQAFDAAGKAFTNNWQDQITAVGSKIQSVVTPHASPLDTIKVALWSISGKTGMPIRVLTGEGAGQLAGSEDRLAYNALIADRQDHTCTSWVNDLLKVLEMAGMLSLPENYCVEWPLDEPLTEISRAELANKNADTLMKLTTAASNMAGDSINLSSALDFVGMADIDIDEVDLESLPMPTEPLAPLGEQDGE